MILWKLSLLSYSGPNTCQHYKTLNTYKSIVINKIQRGTAVPDNETVTPVIIHTDFLIGSILIVIPHKEESGGIIRYKLL